MGTESDDDINKALTNFPRPRPAQQPAQAPPEQPAPATPPPDPKRDASERMAELEYRLETSTRYHHRRRRFFDAVNTAFKIITLSSSTAAFATLVAASPLAGSLLMGLVAAVQVLSLAVEPDKKAADHARRAGAFIDVQREAELAGEPTADVARRLWARVYEVEHDEPPTKQVLIAMAHNDYAKRIGSRDLVPITPWQRRLANFIDLKPHTLRLPEG